MHSKGCSFAFHFCSFGKENVSFISAFPDSKGVPPKANIPENKLPAEAAAAAIATEGIPMMKKGRAAA